MKRHSYPKRWGRLFERYCAQFLPDRKDEICERVDRNYTELMMKLPDIGLGENSCDYWYVGDRSPALEAYRGLEKI